MTQPWFRFYRAVVNSPKIQRLPPVLFKAWVNILCSTDDDGALPSVSDLAFTLRSSEREVAKTIAQLIDAGLLADVDGMVTAHDWHEHQRKGDTSNERVKRFRQRDRNATCNVTGNAPEADTEADTEQTLPNGSDAQAAPVADRSAQKRRKSPGIPLPSDWKPSPGHFQKAAELGLDCQREADRMRSWAEAKDARNVRWDAAFTGWLLRSKGEVNGGKPIKSGRSVAERQWDARRRGAALSAGYRCGDDGVWYAPDGSVVGDPAGEGASPGH